VERLRARRVVVLLGAFLWHGMRRGRAALIDLHLFADRSFSAAATTQFLSNCVSFGGQMLLPLYLLLVAGRSPGSTGVLLAASGLGMLCSYPLTGRLTERFGPRRVSSAGAFIALLGTLPFALIRSDDLATATLLHPTLRTRCRTWMYQYSSMSAAYSSVPKATIPIAATAINIVQRLGGPVARPC